MTKSIERDYIDALMMQKHMSKTMDEEMISSSDEFYNKEFTLSYNGKSVNFFICPEVWEMMERLLDTYKEVIEESYL